MRLTAGITAFAVATLAAASLSAQTPIERGMKAFAEQKCSVCHSVGGKGNAKGPLDDVGSRLTPDVIREWITNPIEMTKKANATRKPPMKSNPNLAKEDLDGLVAYLSSLKKK